MNPTSTTNLIPRRQAKLLAVPAIIGGQGDRAARWLRLA
jgi:hypothetical protein